MNRHSDIKVIHEAIDVPVSFDAFTSRLEGLLGRYDPAVERTLAEDAVAAKQRIEAMAGEEGLMLFGIQNHGGLFALHGERRKAKRLGDVRGSCPSLIAMPRLTLAVLLVANAACGGRAIQASPDEGPDRVDATVPAPQFDGAASAQDAADGGTLDGSAAAVDAPSSPIPDDSAAAGDAPDDAGPAGTLDSSVFVSDAGSCGTGIVTFRLDPGPHGQWEYSISGDEEPNWLALFSTSEMPLYTAPSERTTLDCTTCLQPWAIPIGYGTAALGDAGTEETWDGLFFAPDDAGTCSKSPGGPYGSGCVTPECAPPGPYVAFMCACGSDAPASSGLPSSYGYAVAACANPTCVRVPFEYPSPAVVVGTVGGE